MRGRANTTRHWRATRRPSRSPPVGCEVYPRLASVLRYHLGREKEADQWMEKLVTANPKSAPAHYLRGGHLKGLGANDEALKEARKSLELAPDNRDGLRLAAQCCITDKQIDKAREYAARSIKLYPNDIDMYAVLADIELQTGNQDKAVAVIEDGLKATSRNPQLLWDLASVLIDLGKPNEADKVIRELATADYPRQLADYLKARSELAQEHWLAARQDLEKVRGPLYQWPSIQKQADVWLGQCYGRMGNRDLEAASYRRALKTDPSYAPAREGLIRVLQASGDVEAALAEYDEQLSSASLASAV